MNPLLLEFPDSFDTDRLTIRGPRLGDGAELNAAVHESQAKLKPWMPWAQTLPTPEESEANIRKAIAQFIAQGNGHKCPGMSGGGHAQHSAQQG